MTKADVIFKENIKKIMEEGVFSENATLFTKTVDKLIQNTLRERLLNMI